MASLSKNIPYLLTPLIFYLTLHLIGTQVLWPRDHGMDPEAQRRASAFLHGFFSSPQELPPLVKWDAVWYAAVATDHYKMTAVPASNYKGGFFPLYPFSVGALMGLTGLSFGFMSALFSIFILTLIFWMLRRTKPVAFALLLFPTAFILVSPYSEGLFLLLALAQRRQFERKSALGSAGFGVLLGLTRIHSHTVAFAYIAEALIGAIKARSWKALKGGVGAALSIGVGIAAYFSYWFIKAGDFFHYLKVKKFFGSNFTSPVETMRRQIAGIEHMLSLPLTWSKVAMLIEWGTFGLLIWMMGILIKREKYFEAAQAFGVLLFSMMPGSFWGIQRFTYAQPCLIAFLVLLFSKRRRSWVLALVAAVLLILQGIQFYAYLMQLIPSV